MEKPRNFKLRVVARTAVLCGFLGACGGEGKIAPASHPSSENDAANGHQAHAHHGAGHHHRFNDAAKWAKQFDDPARDAWQKPASVVGAMALAPGMSVADVGAGTGYFLPHLVKAVGPAGKVVAEDIEPDMTRWIAERAKREGLANVEVVLGSPTDPHLQPNTLDRILVVDTWHHIDNRPAFAKKLADALKSNGVVFIVDFTEDAPEGPPKAARLSPSAVIADLAAAGLEATLVKSDLPHQYIVSGLRK